MAHLGGKPCCTYDIFLDTKTISNLHHLLLVSGIQAAYGYQCVCWEPPYVTALSQYFLKRTISFLIRGMTFPPVFLRRCPAGSIRTSDLGLVSVFWLFFDYLYLIWLGSSSVLDQMKLILWQLLFCYPSALWLLGKLLILLTLSPPSRQLYQIFELLIREKYFIDWIYTTASLVLPRKIHVLHWCFLSTA